MRLFRKPVRVRLNLPIMYSCVVMRTPVSMISISKYSLQLAYIDSPENITIRGMTLLMFACTAGNAQVVRLLLKHNTYNTLNEPFIYGKTPEIWMLILRAGKTANVGSLLLTILNASTKCVCIALTTGTYGLENLTRILQYYTIGDIVNEALLYESIALDQHRRIRYSVFSKVK